MAGKTLLSLAVPWILLWLLVTLLEAPFYIHDPTRPLWQPLVLFASSAVAALIVVAAWSRAPDLKLAPAFIAGMVAMHYGFRVGIFALAGSHYDFTPSDSFVAFQAVKYALFYGLWVALTFGAQKILAAPAPSGTQPKTRLQVQVGDKVRLIEATAIDWLEADDNYVRIHTGGQDYALRSTLRQVLADLGEELFVRIHKSAAVNVTGIETLQPLAKGDAELVLRGGVKLRVSRRFRQDLQNRINA